eukprot:m.226090 g.226090  ORF g.226090 m.226090 type:complete len:158 (+) comp16875_c0_seq1:1334-1807(+)
MASRGCCEADCVCDCGLMQTLGRYRNPIASSIAGILFAVGWWLVIDAGVIDGLRGEEYLCGVGSTVGLLMVNAVSIRQGDSSIYTSGKLGSAGVRAWMFFGLMISFGALASAIWVMVAHYITAAHQSDYAGLALFFQNFCILLSSILFKFGRTDDTW